MIIVIYGAVRDVVGDLEVGIDEFECMIQTLLCFTSRLMSNMNIDTTILLAYIKLFLSACDLFKNKVYIMHNDDAMWYSKGNFLSLLNLPRQVLKFGNLRYYWEGSRERSIQQIKPYLINMRLTSSFFKTKLTQMLVNETLDTIEKDISSLDVELDHGSSHHHGRFSSFKTYSAHDDMNFISDGGKAVSVVYLSYKEKPKRFYICQRSNIPRKCFLFQVSFLDDEGFNKCGLWYAPIQIAIANLGDEMSQEEIYTLADDYAILSPCISNNHAFRLSFGVICKSWRYRDKNNILSLPTISKSLFVSTLNP